MDSNKYLNDITEIRNIMQQSSRFISLSGLSGILAGIYALIGAGFAHWQLNRYLFKTKRPSNTSELKEVMTSLDLLDNLLLIAGLVLFFAVVTGIILSFNKAKASGEKFWAPSSKRLLFHFFIPLITGGLFCLVLLQQEKYGLVAPATLIFYGLACVNASKYTIGDVLYLGITIIVIGLIATQFIGYGLYFWALGFGVFHIVYGSMMHFKQRKE